MVLPRDPVKREEALKNIKEAAIRRSQNPEWKRKNKELGERLSQDPEWKRKNKEGIERRSQNPEWIKHNKEAMQKLAEDPEWNRKNKEMCKIRSQNQEWKDKIGIGNTGKVRTDEWKQMMSEKYTGEGNPFYGKHHDPEKFTGEKNGMFGRQRSEEAKLATSLANKGKRLGADNPAWNGGITPLRKSIRESTEMYEWKRKVMERDDYRDADTGERGEFEVHHIIPLEELLQKYNIQTLDDARNCEALWDINNGKTMLYENHRKFHGLMGEDEGE